MMYDIQMKNDISSGAVLTVRFPEDDIDKKALYTIQSDQPKFLVPFLLRNVDGYAECTYQLGMRSELRHRFGSHPSQEYVKFWTHILQPLLDCDDWFLKPSSFVLDTNYLYVDRSGAVISYIYIPCKTECMEAGALKAMVTELSNKNSTDDQRLENQVWRALAQDFQPRNFLQMLSESMSTPSPTDEERLYAAHMTPAPQLANHSREQQQVQQVDRASASAPVPGHVPSSSRVNDIQISLPNESKKKKGLFGSKKEKSPKQDKPEKKGIWGSKSKNKQGEIVLGAAGEFAQYVPPKQQHTPAPSPVYAAAVGAEDGVTQIMEEAEAGVPYLRLVGDDSLPRSILVPIQPGCSFTIGRFDVSVGQKQSNFEFDKRTKAVSRHHAVIERLQTGEYHLKDLASSAGTFLNGARLTPNMSYPISRNDRISFGTCGADYIWEG